MYCHSGCSTGQFACTYPDPTSRLTQGVNVVFHMNLFDLTPQLRGESFELFDNLDGRRNAYLYLHVMSHGCFTQSELQVTPNETYMISFGIT